ncbi:hypothetical protein KKF34_14585 [Myxococcota bacterium]|nr:hypothetical protein [Myxococcota bacterium]MBU1382098.1 hypothetical protein [Myxococcota bacterium]MBU1498101.1 hypothetical protein [Myxococcota bacterium]
MISERRNIIRRYLTGGLALGLPAGLCLAIPDLVKIISSGNYNAISIITAFHVAISVCTAGIMGFIVGLIVFAIEKFGADTVVKTTYYKYSITLTLGVLALYPITALKIDTFSKAGIAAILTAGIYFSSGFLFSILKKISSAYISSSVLLITAVFFAAAGFAAATESIGFRYIPSFLFWEVLALGLFLISMLLIWTVLSIRSRKQSLRRRMTDGSILARPMSSVVLLFAALAGITWVSWTMKHSPQTIGVSCERCYTFLTSGKKYIPKTTVNNSPSVEQSVPGKFRINRSTSMVLITSDSGMNITSPGGSHYTNVRAAHKNTLVNLATLFSGNHYGMRVHLAPWLPMDTITLPSAMKEKWGYHLYAFTDTNLPDSPWLRTNPYFGFSKPMVSKDINKVFKVLDLLKQPFFVWIHFNKPSQIEYLNDLITNFNKNGIPVFTLFWNRKTINSTQMTASLFSPLLKEKGSNTKLIALGSVLCGLTGGNLCRGRDHYAAAFPATSRSVIFVTEEGPLRTKLNNAAINSLERRITKSLKNNRLKISDISPYREKQKQLKALDRLICRGRIEETDQKQLGEYAQFPSMDPDILRRLDLVELRIGRKDLPDWIAEIVSKSFRNKDNRIDPLISGWIKHIYGLEKNNSSVIKACPALSL